MSVKDIHAILEKEKPDPEKVRALREKPKLIVENFKELAEVLT